jgi:circadian clock protein KaiB
MSAQPKLEKPEAARAGIDTPAHPAPAVQDPGSTVGYCLRLYITGATPRSSRAVRAIQHICERYLTGRYNLEVVDLFEEPHRAAEAQVIAAPTLVKETPSPVRRFVGDLSDENRVLGGLGLSPAG